MATGTLLGGTLAPAIALAQHAQGHQPGDDDGDDDNAAQIVVTGVRSLTSDKIPEGAAHAPQSITIVSH